MDDDEYRCPYHPDQIVDGEVEDPYVMELYGESVMMPNCPECYYQASQEI